MILFLEPSKPLKKIISVKFFNLEITKVENLMDMISIMENSLSSKAIVDFQPMQPGDVKDGWADVDYSTEKLGYNPKTDMVVEYQKF